MRSAVLGAALHREPEARIAFVEASARVTHTHPDGIAGAQLVALAAALSASGRPEAFPEEARALVPDWPWPVQFPPRGPSGYVVHTTVAAITLWQAHGEDAPAAIEAAVRLGGDTDTVAAIVGGIVSAAPGARDLPPEWLRYTGWPTPSDIRRDEFRPPGYLPTLAHHLLLLPVVLAYGFRRLLPPY